VNELLTLVHICRRYKSGSCTFYRPQCTCRWSVHYWFYFLVFRPTSEICRGWKL